MKPTKPSTVFATVPRILPNGGTVLVLGSGPSLTKTDVEYARDRVDAVIAVNDTYKLAPWATALYAADEHWWKWHQGAVEHEVNRLKYPAFTGQFKYSLKHTGFPGVEVLKKGPETGLSSDPSTVALGRNGVYQAINVGIHFGGTRILLLGVDMKNDKGAHFFGRHPNNTEAPYAICMERFATMVEPLKKLGVEVLNCTRSTALKCFPCVRLEDALQPASPARLTTTGGTWTADFGATA